MINHAATVRRYPLTRRVALAAVGVAMLAGCTSPSAAPSSALRVSSNATDVPASADPTQAAAVDKVVQDEMKARHLRAVIVRVTVDGQEIVTKAYGESMTGVPATTDMHFRNGAVAISYVSTLLLRSSTRRRSAWTTSLRSGCPRSRTATRSRSASSPR